VTAVSDLESPGYLITVVFASSVALAFGAAAVAQMVRRASGPEGAGTPSFAVSILFNWILAAAAATPFAFATASRDEQIKGLIETHGLSTLSLEWTVAVAVFMTIGQVMWIRGDLMKLAGRLMVNWLLASAAIVAYLVLWLGLWVVGVVGAYSGGGCVNC
jgi:hypothetical protein